VKTLIAVAIRDEFLVLRFVDDPNFAFDHNFGM
jgi:hypothetical protein